MSVLIPKRHPDRPRPIPAGIRAIATAMAIRDPNPRQWQILGERLTVGDEPMDRLVEWMAATGTDQTRPLFEQALNGGIASVPDAPAPLREFFDSVETPPDWVDPDLLRTGQRALRRGGADGMYIARDVSLLGGYQFSGFNKTLLRTGALEKGSNKRFAETMQWAMDVIAEGGLEPLGVGYRSTIRVRLIHSFVRRHVAAMPDWRADEWGVPVNQTDMAATLVGALVAPAVGSIAMGVVSDPVGVPCRGPPDPVRRLSDRRRRPVAAKEFPGQRPGAVAHAVGTGRTGRIQQAARGRPWSRTRWRGTTTTCPGLRRRLARAQHLSITSAFLGRRTVEKLGLPSYALPWYPLLRLPVNLARSATALGLPGGMARADQRGQREHAQLLRTMTGEDAPATIGESAAHVSRVA